MIKPQLWYLYMIRCSDNSLYTGITIDVSRRFSEHLAQGKKCAKYLRGKVPLTLVYQLPVLGKREAYQLEKKFKKLSKTEKELNISEFKK